jgi:hypothetical protein
LQLVEAPYQKHINLLMAQDSQDRQSEVHINTQDNQADLAQSQPTTPYPLLIKQEDAYAMTDSFSCGCHVKPPPRRPDIQQIDSQCSCLIQSPYAREQVSSQEIQEQIDPAGVREYHPVNDDGSG